VYIYKFVLYLRSYFIPYKLCSKFACQQNIHNLPYMQFLYDYMLFHVKSYFTPRSHVIAITRYTINLYKAARGNVSNYGTYPIQTFQITPLRSDRSKINNSVTQPSKISLELAQNYCKLHINNFKKFSSEGHGTLDEKKYNTSDCRQNENAIIHCDHNFFFPCCNSPSCARVS
jgi:hypothetical protein